MLTNQIMDALDPARAFQGLTPKQEAYAYARFQGLSQIDAYREAYGRENSEYAQISRDASLMDRNPKVVQRIRQFMEEQYATTRLLPRASPELIETGIMQIAMLGEKETNRLNAWVHLGKIAGIDLFRETTRVERVDRTAEDVDKELKAKLQAMMAAMTIDGTANPPAPAAAAKPQPAGKPDRRRKPVAR